MRRDVRKKIFKKTIHAWYKKHRRALPWRATRDPYRILVSEVMLQQTQVDRVLPKYREFLRLFPTMKQLAAAPRSAVIRAWAGLGYNNRAVRLQRAVQTILSQHHGRFPTSVEELEVLPGIGPYTARAVATFAFGKKVAATDTNHIRVIGRFFFGVKPASAKSVQGMDDRLVPSANPDAWNHALMDFGAIVCRSRPRCHECPLQTVCRAYPAVLSKKTERVASSERFFGSDRFFRGRIVDLLRAGDYPREDLLKRLMAAYEVSARRLTAILDALRKDGVIHQRSERSQQVFSLDETRQEPSSVLY